MENKLINFADQIKNGNIEIINQDTLIIENYPYGFKTCKMTFNKKFNRNGQIIERFSEINGKTSKPKKTTAYRINIFVYDKQLKRHFIVCIDAMNFCLYTTNFYNANAVFENYHFSYTSKEYQHDHALKSRKEYRILLDFFKDYMNITPEVYNKMYELNGDENLILNSMENEV